MRYFLTTILFLATKGVLACSCVFLGALSKVDIERTDYIALVRIKEILPVKIDSPKYQGDIYFKIIVEELSHYKGNHLTEIIVEGGHEKFNTWTSCDFGMTENDEWVIFGQKHQGQTFIFPCWRTVMYRHANGFRDLQYKTGINEVEFLNAFFNKKVEDSTKKRGEVSSTFPMDVSRK